MRYSAQISAQRMSLAMAHSPDVGEWQLESIIECAFKYAVRGNAYPCIVGSGENATILHYGEP